jgi:lipid II:glycine glycyltransferase (peptidoglycan interpeptide bridge formation enzyme)
MIFFAELIENYLPQSLRAMTSDSRSTIGLHSIHPRHSTAILTTHESDWDSFLAKTPLGQFQQTCRWAQVKAMDGWNSERLLVNPSNLADGGLQILWKPTRLGRIGYVSKGPVLKAETATSVSAILASLTTKARSLNLRAMILQPPDESVITMDELKRHHFSPKPVDSVVRATATIDLRGGYAAWEDRMHSKARQQARTAIKRGVTVTQGGSADLGMFYELMCATCRRQNTRPNPARLELLEALWSLFHPHIRLGFAWADGAPIAGLLMLGHGSRMTFWKKGWNSSGAQLYANCLLNMEALRWAHDWGYTSVDFGAVDPLIATTLAAGGHLTEEQLRSRDMFNLRLGAVPHQLPPARLLIINPALRVLFLLSDKLPPLSRWLMRKMGAG